MKKIKEYIPGIIALAIMVLVAIGLLNLMGKWLAAIGAGFLNLINSISTLDTVLVIALISAAITILGLIVNSVISVGLKASEHRNKAKADIRIKMEKPYSDFVSLIFDLMQSAKQSKMMSDQEMLDRMIGFSKEVTLYGSNKVVKRWSRYRTSADKLTPLENMTQMENILFAIREDLGIKKRGMGKGDILSLFINDIQESLDKKDAK